MVIILWGHLLNSDSLYFGYKAKTSTTHCTWLVSKVVQHMLRGGINPRINPAGLFMGAVCYADDVLLIAPTRNAMQRMLLELEKFADESTISFNTDPVTFKSKSKCPYIVGKKENLEKPAPLSLWGRELPWINQAYHLGNTLTVQGDMEQDASIKRAKFINS